jgi:hypothetical protein
MHGLHEITVILITGLSAVFLPILFGIIDEESNAFVDGLADR